MPSNYPELVNHRITSNNPAAILFVHGFSGDPTKTWGKFPELLKEEKRLSSWDIFSLGYHTGLSLDIVGIWRADPELAILAKLLATSTGIEPLDRYASLALIAHSMGGLVVQRAILDHKALRDRVSQALLFGTPSAGLKKASLFKFWKPQLRDMANDSDFIKDLRARWAQQVVTHPTFRLYATAGDEDQFVPPESSIFPFLPDQRRVVRGDHLSIVKPPDANDSGLKVAIESLAGHAPPSGPADSARVAVEMGEFNKAIQTFGDHPESLDQGGLVQLALALESVGRQEEAIKALQNLKPNFTDAMGVLAGRLKRRWLVERRSEDAEKACQLYQQGFELSEQTGRHDQAFYHGINMAFMQLAYREQLSAAQETAKKVLEHCRVAKLEMWRLATEGEANLLLGNIDLAMDGYRSAVACNPSPKPREYDSMFQQSVRVASLLGNESAADRLQEIFRRGA